MIRNNDTDDDSIERGIYLAADSPRSFIPLALEGGSGDKYLLGEVLVAILSDDELDELVELVENIQECR